MSKMVKTIIAVVVGLFLLVVIIAIATEGDEQPAADTNVEPAKASLKTDLAEAREHLKSVKRDGGQVIVTYDTSDEMFWDENRLIGQLAMDTVDVLAAAFAWDGVKRVNVIYLAEMTDEFGNTETERAVEIEWTRALWANVKDPESFKDRLLLDEALMYELATSYYVHPGVWKETKLREEGMPATGKAQ